MPKSLLAVAVLSTALVGAACDGSGTAPEPRELTQAELAAVNRTVLGIGSGLALAGAMGGPGASRDAQAAGSGTFAFTVDFAQPCDPSGDVAVAGSVSGSYDQAAQDAQVQANATLSPRACGVRTDGGGVVRLTGDPSLVVALTGAADAGVLTALHITQQGAFTWEKGGSSGRCTVSVTGDLVAGSGNQVRLTGDFCGWSLDGTVVTL
ncbi:MAG TPA: hypothetical protein VEW03_11540 [Longimicrobiaceae bacterium]|nr:hypothetical protein [Longimicrobiaceae bacterium]